MLPLVVALTVALSAPCPAPDHTAPTRPGPLLIDVSSGGVVLRWAPSTDDRGPIHYQVYERDRLVTTVTEPGYQYSAFPPPPGIFIFAVRTIDEAGNVSAAAYQSLGRIWRGDEVPPAPTDLRLASGVLSWTAPALPPGGFVPPVAGYEVLLDGRVAGRLGGTSFVLDERARVYGVRAINAVDRLSPVTELVTASGRPPSRG
ncbi:hypothetical protein AB0M54_05540 [Actinoplanes sp. NPDC051470]|uniref:hypothetical protein n=1 Tax=Actinoplanes sp. NPDC051470 TaxID=3157224 RepID=UPI003438B5B1